jgi:hypothetical protein
LSDEIAVAAHAVAPAEAAAPPGDGFDLSSLAFLDTAEMEVLHPVTQEPLGWVILFAGPGHPTTVKLSNEASKRMIKARHVREEAQVNGRKWHADPETPEGNIQENSKGFARRMLGWSGRNGPVRLDGRDMPFSVDLAAELLANPRYGWLYRQVAKFVMADEGFLSASETA